MDILSLAILPWLAPLLVIALRAGDTRRGPRGAPLARSLGLVRAALPSGAAFDPRGAPRFGTFVDRPRRVVTGQAEFGNLLGPLDALQSAGIWLHGDFRLPLVATTCCGPLRPARRSPPSRSSRSRSGSSRAPLARPRARCGDARVVQRSTSRSAARRGPTPRRSRSRCRCSASCSAPRADPPRPGGRLVDGRDARAASWSPALATTRRDRGASRSPAGNAQARGLRRPRARDDARLRRFHEALPARSRAAGTGTQPTRCAAARRVASRPLIVRRRSPLPRVRRRAFASTGAGAPHEVWVEGRRPRACCATSRSAAAQPGRDAGLPACSRWRAARRAGGDLAAATRAAPVVLTSPARRAARLDGRPERARGARTVGPGTLAGRSRSAPAVATNRARGIVRAAVGRADRRAPGRQRARHAPTTTARTPLGRSRYLFAGCSRQICAAAAHAAARRVARRVGRLWRAPPARRASARRPQGARCCCGRSLLAESSAGSGARGRRALAQAQRLAQPLLDLPAAASHVCVGDEREPGLRAPLASARRRRSGARRRPASATASNGASSTGPSAPKTVSALKPARSTHGRPQASISCGTSE